MLGTAHAVRRSTMLAGLACLLLAGAQSGVAGASPAVLDTNSYGPAAYGGWAAWSRVDETTKQFSLVVRSPAGVISLAPVAERPREFDVQLGPHGAGVVAVYSRCSDLHALTGCRIYALALAEMGAGEQALPVASASAHEPAIWKEELAYLGRDPAGGGSGPDRLFRQRLDGGTAKAVGLPVSEGRAPTGEYSESVGPGRLPKGIREGQVTGVTISAGKIAYITNSSRGEGIVHLANLWVQGVTGRPQLVDQDVLFTPAALCENRFVSSVIVGHILYAYVIDCGTGSVSSQPSGVWMRYDLKRRTKQIARFPGAHFGDSESVAAVLPDGGGVLWSDNGQIKRLAKISWRPARRLGAEGICGPAHPIC